MAEYRKRVADGILMEKLEATGAVIVEGPKWCGKTTTAERVAKSVIYMAEPKKRERNLLYARLEPEKILDGECPRLVDEWQIAPILWDAIRHRVDHDDSCGRFILTGSAVPAKRDDMKHTGTGRFSWLKMRPMSLWESGDSLGSVSLEGLFDGDALRIADAADHRLEDIAFLVCRGCAVLETASRAGTGVQLCGRGRRI